MLKTFGTLYTNNKEDLQEILALIEPAGFQIAYVNEAGGNIIKEVEDLNNNQNGGLE